MSKPKSDAQGKTKTQNKDNEISPQAERNLSIEETFVKLDEIIERLESEDVSLEESFRLYTEGMELAALCNSSIEEVEKKVMALNSEGELEEFLIK